MHGLHMHCYTLDIILLHSGIATLASCDIVTPFSTIEYLLMSLCLIPWSHNYVQLQRRRNVMCIRILCSGLHHKVLHVFRQFTSLPPCNRKEEGLQAFMEIRIISLEHFYLSTEQIYNCGMIIAWTV